MICRVVMSYEDHKLVPEQHSPTVKPPWFQITSVVLIGEDAPVGAPVRLGLDELPDLVGSRVLASPFRLDELHRPRRAVRKKGAVFMSV